VRLELHPEARAELGSAALWYHERRTGLGDEFVAEVSGTPNRIGNAPESYPAWPGTPAVDQLIRKATVQRFLYVIAFERHEQHLLKGGSVAHVRVIRGCYTIAAEQEALCAYASSARF
jgi:hypothetical protein